MGASVVAHDDPTPVDVVAAISEHLFGFRLLKESKVLLHPDMEVQADTGYMGLQKVHVKIVIPKKRTRKNPLTKEDKKSNRTISSIRVKAENVPACVKRFKIVAEKYRNRRRRFGLRFFLIAATYNVELHV